MEFTVGKVFWIILAIILVVSAFVYSEYLNYEEIRLNPKIVPEEMIFLGMAKVQNFSYVDLVITFPITLDNSYNTTLRIHLIINSVPVEIADYVELSIVDGTDTINPFETKSMKINFMLRENPIGAGDFTIIANGDVI